MEKETKKIKRNIKPFNGEKYSIWKFRIRALIAEEDALQVLDKDRPETVRDEWKKQERIAKGIIIEHLSDSMIGFATEEDTSRNILQKLDAIYERKSLATQLIAVEKKLLSFKFKGDTALTKHFMDFDEMVVELQASGEKLNEMGKVARLLLTLPTSYDAVVTAIQTLSDDTLSLAFVKTRLLGHEIKLRNECSETSTKVLQTEVKRITNNKIQINKDGRIVDQVLNRKHLINMHWNIIIQTVKTLREDRTEKIIKNGVNIVEEKIMRK